ncbi:MAG: single-stranded DNA-binding protein [Candidatus Dormibacteraeota bacterium]|nr:single-stranded DNA-binding protein [Candidatus Dormibacteraeota bacterium]MDQ6899831.1 single-stranded DNA-binding protein [Candidatus Dormibacteraeota bacterium]
MVNKVIFVGRLAADPEVRALPTGTHVTTLRLVTNTYAGKSEDGTRKEHTEFHNLVLFGGLAELAGGHLQKGRQVYADGRLHHRSWEGDDGKRRYATEVVVENLQMLGSRSGANGGAPGSETWAGSAELSVV